jgi:hypothetical protein
MLSWLQSNSFLRTPCLTRLRMESTQLRDFGVLTILRPDGMIYGKFGYG